MQGSNPPPRGVNLFYLILAILFGLAALFAYAVWWPREAPKPVGIIEAPTTITSAPAQQLAFETTSTASSSLPVPQATTTLLVLVKSASTTVSKVAGKVVPPTKNSVQSDHISPTTPGDLVVRSVSYKQVIISWSPSTDNRGVAGYAIYQDSALIGSTVKTIQGFIRLVPSTKYTFGVAAFDAAGNSSQINTILVTTTIKPVAVTVTPAPVPVPSPVTPLPPSPPPAPINLCGNGIQDKSEQCDMGSLNGSGVDCKSDCTLNYCGDSYIDTALESCDDGASNGTYDVCDIGCHIHKPLPLPGAATPPAASPSPSSASSPNVTVTASPSSITNNSTSNISWTSTNATSCSSNSGGGSGTTGSFTTPALTSSRSYTVNCTGGGGSGSGNASVTVAAAPGGATTYVVNVTSAGNYSPTSLTLKAGDSINFVYTPPISGEVVTRFTPSTVSSVMIDSEFTSKTRVFPSSGTWTFKAEDHNGNTGTVTVQ